MDSDPILERGIKAVIDEFPAVGTILDEYDIGCAPCNVGTCLLKDIVEIHNLAPDTEAELLTRIARAMDPDAPAFEPREAADPGAPKALSYSPPMQMLVDEHKLIMRWVSSLPAVAEQLDIEAEGHRQLVADGLDFIRLYADKFHHAKEEDILFGYFEGGLDIIDVMLTDHDTARGHVKAAAAALESRDRASLVEHLLAYHELLTEHIRKEDEILYPWMDRILTTRQVGELYSRFSDVSREAPDTATTQERFVERAEARFGTAEESA